MTKAISGPPAGVRTLSNTGIGITTPKGVRFVKSKLKCVVIAWVRVAVTKQRGQAAHKRSCQQLINGTQWQSPAAKPSAA